MSGEETFTDRDNSYSLNFSESTDESNIDTNNSELDSDGSRSDDDSIQSDSECPDDNFLWEKLVITTSMCDNPIEVFAGYIYLYMQSEDDELFNQMIDRISNAIYKPIAIEHTIDENYNTIVEYINDKSHGFWYEIGKEGKKWKCEWFRGNKCDCTECEDLSVRDVVKEYIKLFLEMQNNELIQKNCHFIQELTL